MDIVERLQIDFWREGDLDLKEAADEIERLRQRNAELMDALRLIAIHPVETSGQWEVGAKEMIRLAAKTIKGE